MITFKNIQNSDEDFIERLYRSTREKELSITNWPEDQKQRFVRMQLMAQMAEYSAKYRNGSFRIILYKKKPAGRLFLFESADENRIIDISLLPEFQGKGIAKKIMLDLVESAGKNNKKISLYVAKDNVPAKKLYEGLGFKKLSEMGMYEYMEWGLV